MKNGLSNHLRLTNLRSASIIRKFAIFFILMSILPLSVLYYFYIHIENSAHLQLNTTGFSIAVFLVVLGIIIGFLLTRNILRGISDITRVHQDTIENVLGKEKAAKISAQNDEVAILDQTFQEITTYIDNKINSLEESKRSLNSVLAKVGDSITTMEDIDAILDLVVETTVEAYSAQKGALLLLKEESDDLHVKAIFGATGEFVPKRHLRVTRDLFEPVFSSRQPWIFHNDDLESRPVNELKDFLTAPMLCAPIIQHRNVSGVILICERKIQEEFTVYDLNFLSNIAAQTALALENAQLAENVETTYLETITALASAVDAKDSYSSGHLERVALYAGMIAKTLKLGEEEIKIVKNGARLHDIGKIGITDEILNKMGKLSPEEWAIMKKHTEIGEKIVKSIKSFDKIRDIIRHHHEACDGSGYPDGLKGEEISIYARIVSVADVFDALITDRPYRKAFSMDDAKSEMEKMKGKLDLKIVDALFKTIDAQG